MCKLLCLATITSAGWIAILVIIGILVFVTFAYALAKRYVKVGPNDVLVISADGAACASRTARTPAVGFRIAKGGGRSSGPSSSSADVLSLEIMTLDVQTPEVYTIQGVPIVVDGVAQIKVKGDDISIRTAAEQFLGKGKHEIDGDRPADGRGPPARHPGHDDRRGDLQEPRRVRPARAGSRRRRHGQHGPDHRLASPSATSATARATSTRSASRASPRSSATP